VSQTPLFVLLHLVGTCVCLGFGPRDRPWLCCAMGFPIGLATVIVLLLPLLVLGAPFDGITAGAVATIPTIAGAWRARGADWRKVTVWTLGFAAVCAPLTLVNLTIVHWDGHNFVMLGKAIAGDGGLRAPVLVELNDFGVFQALAHAGVAFTRESYLYSLPTVFGLAAIPLFALALADAGVRPRGVALVTAALFTSFMVQLHFFYLHANFAAAIYLFVFGFLIHRGDPRTLPVAFVALTAFALSRVETPVAAALFLVVADRWPRRTLLPVLTAHVAIVAGWYLLIAPSMPPDGAFLTPTRCYLAAGLYLGVYGWFLANGPRVERLAVAAAALALVAAFAHKPAHMGASLGFYAANLFVSRWWLGCWWIVVALWITSRHLPAPPRTTLFTSGIPLYVALVLLLAYGRIPYRYSLADSASRMMLHVAPLVFYYLALKYTGSGRTTRPPSPASAST
jgi:hypothetical protein